MFKNKRFFQFLLGFFLMIPLAQAGGFEGVDTKDFKFSDLEIQKEFTSEELSTDFDFNSLAFAWQTQQNLEFEVRFFDDKWSKWYHLDASTDGQVREERKHAFIATAPSSKFQYKVHVFNNREAVIDDLKIIYFKARNINDDYEKGQALRNGFLSFAESLNLVAATTTPRSSVRVITRKQWDADESKRIKNKDAGPQITPQNDIKEKYAKFKNELKVIRKVTKNSQGKELHWPLEYPQKVKKIFVHHTATTDEALVASAGLSAKQNYKQIVQNIYHYHASTRGWGDVGYHYIIDPEGRIYEGRYGEAIGAHAIGFNHGSIGIAMIGNYETNEVPKKAFDSLVKLIANRTGKYKIKADGKTKFRGENSHNILGHKDVNSTTCPGRNLYKRIPQIRKMVASLNSKTRSNLPYEFTEVSSVYAVDLNRNQTKQVKIKLKNIGKRTWGGGSYLALDISSANQSLLSFPDKKGAKFAVMKERSVRPGGIATFEFRVKSKNISGVSELSLTPFIKASNRNQRINHKVYLPVFVSEPIYTYSVGAKKLPPATLKKGAIFNGYIDLKNTGNITWSRTANAVVIGADRPRDRKSIFVRKKPFTRMAFMRDKEVKPGETTRFYFSLKAPDQPGLYKEFFTPLVEGITWMQDKKLNFTTYVYTDQYSGLISSMKGSHTFTRNQKNRISFKLKNVGGVIWRARGKNKITVDVKGAKGVAVTKKNIPSKDVKPGQEIEITLDIKPNALAPNGTLEIMPKVAGKKLMRMPKRFYYRIDSAKNLKRSINKKSSTKTATSSSSSKDEDIRIKLTFDEKKPVVTSSNGMYLYSNGKKITTYKKGEKVTVSYSGRTYRVRKGSSTRSTSKPPKLVPKRGSILEIVNMERRPAWNQKLNDNQFRGSLEFYADKGSLVTINELPLEEYLQGLAENTNTEQIEKIKALIVAARTYAKFYMTVAEKFPGKPWHLDDNPDVSQKYLGYGYEKRAPNVVKAVKATKGEVVKYRNKLIKTPYFSQSAGRTKSAQEVWGWKDTPYLKSVSDKYCKANTLLGHGVGLSGCGARGLADAGIKYKEILKYFYTGVTIGK